MTVLWPQAGPNNAARTTPSQSDTHIPSHQFKSSHMWALAFYSAIWKYMKTGDLCCKPRAFTSTWRLSANGTSQITSAPQDSWSFFDGCLFFSSWATYFHWECCPLFSPSKGRELFSTSFISSLLTWWAPDHVSPLQEAFPTPKSPGALTALW